MTREKLRQVMIERREMKARGSRWQAEYMCLTRIAKKYILIIKGVPTNRWDEVLGFDV